MSMARLWRDQGKRDEARELLAPVYGWFTEGDLMPELMPEKSSDFLEDACLEVARRQPGCSELKAVPTPASSKSRQDLVQATAAWSTRLPQSVD